MKELRPSIMRSIFKRKGGEGDLTKMIVDENRTDYFNQLKLLEEDEDAVLCFKENEMNWLLLTDARIFGEQGDAKFSILFSNLESVSLAIAEAYNSSIYNKGNFTYLLVKEKDGNERMIKVEQGKPFQGVYQTLHYVASVGHRSSIE